MNSRDFRLHVIFRLVVITFGIGGILYFVFIEVNYIRLFFTGVFVLGVLVNLFMYINSTNKETTNFLLSILSNDFSNKYSEDQKGRTFSALYDSFNLINEKLMTLSVEREGQYQYISTLIQQVNVGILSFDRSDHIQLINDAMKRILGVENIVLLETIKEIDLQLFKTLRDIESGSSKLLQITTQGQLRKVSVNASEFVLRGKQYKLISIQDISNELHQNEVDAWQKLISVLTHEIMNSVSPIASLSGTLHSIAAKEKDILTSNDQNNLILGLEAIKERSAGLMNFTRQYRALTKVPLPQISEIEATTFFEQIYTLFTSTIIDSSIEFEIKYQGEVDSIKGDSGLLTQVIINLLKNAKEAINEADSVNGKITMNVSKETSGRCQILIEDTGGGIPEELRDKIFVPFYTSKSGGSGVGLSLARQIIQMHGGRLDYSNGIDGAIFKILF